MTHEEAKEFLIIISYKLGNMSIEYLTEKDGEKMREAIKALEQQTCEDAISREDTLMALTGELTESTDELIHRFIRRIKNLPSVNPQPICKDREKGECPYYAG